jgi:hypothetical protein
MARGAWQSICPNTRYAFAKGQAALAREIGNAEARYVSPEAGKQIRTAEAEGVACIVQINQREMPKPRPKIGHTQVATTWHGSLAALLLP